MTTPTTFRSILGALDSRTFADYAELKEAVRQEFNNHVLELPPGYTHLDVLEDGFDNDWITEDQKRVYAVNTQSNASA